MKKLFVALCAVLVAVGLSVKAEAIPLQDLFDGASLQVDDKLFSNWALFNMTSTNPDFDPDFNLIEVTGLTDDPMNPGLSFEANGQLQVQDLDFLDVFFGFTVEVLDPQYVIKDASLSIGGGSSIGRASDLGDPGIAIYEDIYDQGFNPLASLVNEFDFATSNLTDSAEFDPQSLIFVDKNILLFGLDLGDSANLTGFEQRFSQMAVPEPATLLLLGSGLAGLALARRRSRK